MFIVVGGQPTPPVRVLKYPIPERGLNLLLFILRQTCFLHVGHSPLFAVGFFHIVVYPRGLHIQAAL